MHIYLWILEAFLFLLLVHSLNAIINPEKIVQWTIERYQSAMKFYCFDCEIKPTAKSIKIIRVGHIIVAVLIVIYMVTIAWLGLLH